MCSGRFPPRFWIGLFLVTLFWTLNWSLTGYRTHWGFFPLWLGAILVLDGWTYRRRATSLWARHRPTFAMLFVVSAPMWWFFEALNLLTRNWIYLGREAFSLAEYVFWATLSFSTVIPAVLCMTELLLSFLGLEHLRGRRRWAPQGRVLAGLEATGWLGLALLCVWPRVFYPLVWVWPIPVLEAWLRRLGGPCLSRWTERGDWRPLAALPLGALGCGVLWELWNVRSYPKWIYDVPFFGFWHVFEMPLPGYLGYLPFGLDVYLMTHALLGLLRWPRADVVDAVFEVSGPTSPGEDGTPSLRP